MYASHRESSELMRELKEFAFTQSPMFKDNLIQAMEVSQSFDIVEENPPETLKLPGVLESDRTLVQLCFGATRIRNPHEKPPIYAFTASLTAYKQLHPLHLRLSDRAWLDVWNAYCDEDDFTDEALAALEAGSFPDALQQEVRDNLTDMGAAISLYQQSAFEFNNAEQAIEANYANAIAIDDDLFDVKNTYGEDVSGMFTICETPDGRLYVPIKHMGDELAPGDEIETTLLFNQIIAETGIAAEAEEVGLLSHSDKRAAMLHIVQCLRNRTIELG